MRWVAVIAACTACTGSGPVAPSAPARVQLVRCEVAQPLPHTPSHARGPSGDETFAELLGGGRDPIGAGDGQFGGRSRGGARVTAGEPVVTGSAVDRAALARSLAKSLDEIRTCYRGALARDPVIQGSATVSFSLLAGGVVASRISATGLPQGLTMCVMRAIDHLAMPPLPSGGRVSVVYPLRFGIDRGADSEPSAAPAPHPPGDAPPWTPFALQLSPQGGGAARIARAASVAVKVALPAMDACFRGSVPTGSLRSQLEVAGDGSITLARVGGLGDAAAEACVAKALGAVKVAVPAFGPSEIACDFARGEAAPWRVTAGGGYDVIEVGRTGVRHGGQVFTPSASDPPALPSGTAYLVIADPDAPGAMLDVAFALASSGSVALVALRDGPRAPLLLGVTPTNHQLDDAERAEAWPGLRIGAKQMMACLGRATPPRVVSSDDGRAIDGLAQSLASSCRTRHCASAIRISIDEDAPARSLTEATGALRRAGFDRVLLGTDRDCEDR